MTTTFCTARVVPSFISESKNSVQIFKGGKWKLESLFVPNSCFGSKAISVGRCQAHGRRARQFTPFLRPSGLKSEDVQVSHNSSLSEHPLTTENWEQLTIRLVQGATAVFFFLLLPQIIKNAINLLNGNTSALQAVAWVGYLTALLGNVMLLSYFLERKENGGALVQTVGIATNVVILTQMFIAKCMPANIFATSGVLVLIAACISGLQKQGGLNNTAGEKIWTLWINVLGLLGVASLCQAAATTFLASESWHPAVAGLTAASTVLVLDSTGKFPERYQGIWKGVPAWSATLLFAFQPVAQLVKNFSSPSSLAGLSQATVVLAMVGNGLMVPRALLQRDSVWLAGASWASFTGWLQLLSLFLATAPGGCRYLAWPAFTAATVVYLTFNALVLRKDLKAKKLPVALASLSQLLSTDPKSRAASE